MNRLRNRLRNRFIDSNSLRNRHSLRNRLRLIDLNRLRDRLSNDFMNYSKLGRGSRMTSWPGTNWKEFMDWSMLWNEFMDWSML